MDKIRNNLANPGTAGHDRQSVVTCLSGQRSNAIKESRKTWKASSTVESAIILPLCFLILLLIIQLGVTMFDKYTFSMTAQNWARKQITAGEMNWQDGLQKQLDQNMIFAGKYVVVEQNANQAKLKMYYKALLKIEPFTSWMFTATVELPKDHKKKLYHFLNGKQLASRIPILDQIQQKYFDLVDHLKKD